MCNIACHHLARAVPVVLKRRRRQRPCCVLRGNCAIAGVEYKYIVYLIVCSAASRRCLSGNARQDPCPARVAHPIIAGVVFAERRQRSRAAECVMRQHNWASAEIWFDSSFARSHYSHSPGAGCAGGGLRSTCKHEHRSITHIARTLV